jgi:hypothetical protein
VRCGAAKYRLPNRAFFLPTRDLSFTAEAVRSPGHVDQSGGGDRCGPRCSGTWATPSASVTERRSPRSPPPRPGSSVLAMRAQAEQAPNPNSRVTLGTRRDRFGLPVARVDWRPAASDHASIRASQKAVDAALRNRWAGWGWSSCSVTSTLDSAGATS